MSFTPDKWKGRSTNSVPFGLKGGKLFYVTDVTSGKSCGCVCPECDMPLIARNNPLPDRKRAFHFQHYSKTSCSGGWESARHRMAKEIILKASSLTLPGWTGGEIAAEESAICINGNSIAEIRLLDGQIRPDLKIAGESSSVIFDDLYIEIRVHHAVDSKKAAIVKANGLSMVEIDLSNVTDEQLLDEECFSKIVLEDTSNRKWIHLGNATYLSTAAKKAIIEVISPSVRTRAIPLKSGGTFDVIEQEGRLHNKEGSFPLTFQIPDQSVGADPKPYEPGMYTLSVKSLRVDRYGRLRVGFKIYLDPIEMDASGDVGPEQHSLDF